MELARRGTISVNGGANGSPGNIVIASQDIFLDREGIISASTTQGTQGNITLSGNNLSLRDRSKIITDATQNATGGNIFIDLQENLLGIDNSQITANAQLGQGGNIDINAKGLFFSSDSQINASSEFGVDGLIEVNTLAVEPNSGLIQLPTDPIDPSLYLSQGCSRQQQHEFISVGRGGLPENPLNTIAESYAVPDFGSTYSNLKSMPDLESLTSVDNQTNSVVEAQNWKINQQGKVELTATLDKSSAVGNQISCLK